MSHSWSLSKGSGTTAPTTVWLCSICQSSSRADIVSSMYLRQTLTYDPNQARWAPTLGRAGEPGSLLSHFVCQRRCCGPPPTASTPHIVGE